MKHNTIIKYTYKYYTELKKLGLNAIFDQDGDYVIEQLPAKGTMLYLGEIVYLMVE